MKPSGASSRVKRGFHRIGLLGVLPSILGAVVATYLQFLTPSGEIYTNGFPASLGNTRPSAVIDPSFGNYEKRMQWEKWLDGNNSTDGTLLDGRKIRYFSRGQVNPVDLSTLNAAIVKFEMDRLAAISEYGEVYQSGSFYFKCPQYSKCDPPFPHRSMGHLDRRLDFSIPIWIMVAGTIWYSLVALISWLIRGFMADG